MDKADSILNNAEIRRAFPALETKIYGKPLVYLDNAASAQKPQAVLDCMDAIYKHSYANVHRGLHYLANEATELYENAREKVQHFLGAESSDSIIFTKNATEAINLVAYSWGMANIKEGDEIVLTIMEHHSNLVPWHFLRERLGAKLIFVPVDDNGAFHIEDFDKALTSKTKLAAVTHMSNILGTVTPVREVVTHAHARNIPVLIDGSQGSVHNYVNVSELGCDFYAITGHKLYGPTGIGALYGKSEFLASMRPFLGGGEMIETVSTETVHYNKPPHRFEAGTPPIVEAIGLGAALDFIENTGRDKIYAYERELSQYVHRRLEQIDGLRLLGKAHRGGGILSFNLADIHPHDLAMYLDRQGIAVRAGTHCAEPLLQRFGMKAICRASLAVYNNASEVDALAEALESAKSFFR